MTETDRSDVATSHRMQRFLTTAKGEGTRKHSSVVFRGSMAFLTPWFWTPNLQNCEKTSFCCLSHSVCGTVLRYGGPSKTTVGFQVCAERFVFPMRHIHHSINVLLLLQQIITTIAV